MVVVKGAGHHVQNDLPHTCFHLAARLGLASSTPQKAAFESYIKII
jgi:hypothetical protein